MKSFIRTSRFAAALVGSALASTAADEPAAKRVSLVFDDGPVLEQTEKILAILAQEKVHVNFCYIGKNVDAYPKLARSASKGGHEINDHSYTHPHLAEMESAAVFKEISQCAYAINQATGKKPVWFWSPYLETQEHVLAEAKKAGLTHFPYRQYHFISTDDWNTKETTAAMIFQRATTGIVDKTVILCHEWVPGTLAQLPAIIAELKRQQCVFLTFGELAKSGE